MNIKTSTLCILLGICALYPRLVAGISPDTSVCTQSFTGPTQFSDLCPITNGSNCLYRPYDTTHNVAFNKTVVAKNNVPTAFHQQQFVNDGNYGTGKSWVPESMHAWIKIDLGGCYNITKVKFSRDHLDLSQNNTQGFYFYSVYFAERDAKFADDNDIDDAKEYGASLFHGLYFGGTKCLHNNGAVISTGRYFKLSVSNWAGSKPAIDEIGIVGTKTTCLESQGIATNPPRKTRSSPPTSPPIPGSFGDPHFKTWAGQMFDFHGICDLVLLYNPDFAQGLGMYIHVRTKKTRHWSYISTSAVRIGDDTLEVMGGKGADQMYWINGGQGNPIASAANAKQGMEEEVEDMVLPAAIAGYPLVFNQTSARAKALKIDLGHGEKIVLAVWNYFVRVEIEGATKQNFGTSLGLLGSFETGSKKARDGKTILSDIGKFGQEWQVLASEPKLFHTIEGPQYPIKCERPHAKELRRQLSVSMSLKAAEMACHNAPVELMEACVFDVMATNDKGVAGAY